MTQFLKLVPIFFLLSLLLASCGDGDDNEEVLLKDFEEIPSSSLFMIVDGSEYRADSIETGLGLPAGSFSIQASNDSDLSATFILASSSVGIYEFGTSNGQTPSFGLINFVDGNYTTVNIESSGQIEIVETDEVNNTISGRFNAILVKSPGDSREVVGGLFHDLPIE